MDKAVRFAELRAVYLDTLLKCAALATSPDPEASDRLDHTSSGRPTWLEAEITRGYQQIRTAAIGDPVKPFSNEDFEASVDQLLTFARAHSDFVKQEVARGP